jgi:hypothetical protein
VTKATIADPITMIPRVLSRFFVVTANWLVVPADCSAGSTFVGPVARLMFASVVCGSMLVLISVDEVEPS